MKRAIAVGIILLSQWSLTEQCLSAPTAPALGGQGGGGGGFGNLKEWGALSMMTVMPRTISKTDLHLIFEFHIVQKISIPPPQKGLEFSWGLGVLFFCQYSGFYSPFLPPGLMMMMMMMMKGGGGGALRP